MPKYSLRWVQTGIVLLFLLTALNGLVLPSPAAGDTYLVEFSAIRAMTHVERLATEPRPLGSDAHTLARNYLLTTLAGLELITQVQSAVQALPMLPGQESAMQTVPIHNVVARLPGSGGHPAVLVVAHYDSVPHSPGAGDNATGVAALLEALRALQARGPLARDVIVLFSDGEELGLLGAQAFLAGHDWVQEVGVVVNLDGRGNRGPVLLLEVVGDTGQLVREFAKATAHPWAFGLAFDLYQMMRGDTDFSVFRQAGFPGFNLVFAHGVDAYHAPEDSPGALDLRLLQHMGEQTLALVTQLGNSPTLPAAALIEPNATYFTLPWGGVVTYSAGWNRLLIGVAWMGLLLVLIGQKEVRVAEAIAAGLACVVTGGVVVWAMTQVLTQIAPAGLLRQPSTAILLLWGIGSKTVMAFYWCYHQWRRLLSPMALNWGLWVSHGLLLLVTAVWLPSAHYLLAWPLLGLSIGWLLVPAQYQSLLISSTVALAALWLWLPILYLTYIMLTLEQPEYALAAVVVATSWGYRGWSGLIDRAAAPEPRSIKG